MSDDYTIRGCEPSDYEAIHRMLNHPDATFNTLQVPYTSFTAREKRLAETEPDHHLVIEKTSDKVVVGSCGIFRFRQPRTSHVAEINIVVDQEMKGQGIGTKLLQAAVELADNWLGIVRLQLTVYTDNTGAIRLYEKFGFVSEGCCKSYALRDVIYIDTLMMARIKSQKAC